MKNDSSLTYLKSSNRMWLTQFCHADCIAPHLPLFSLWFQDARNLSLGGLFVSTFFPGLSGFLIAEALTVTCPYGNPASYWYELAGIAVKTSPLRIPVLRSPSIPSQGVVCVNFSGNAFLVSWNEILVIPGHLCLPNVGDTIRPDISGTWRSRAHVWIASLLTNTYIWNSSLN